MMMMMMIAIVIAERSPEYEMDFHAEIMPLLFRRYTTVLTPVFTAWMLRLQLSAASKLPASVSVHYLNPTEDLSVPLDFKPNPT